MPKKPFYSQTAAVPGKKLAGTSPTAGPRLGSQTPTIVPKKPGFTKALVQPQKLKVSHKRPRRAGHR